jgi:hypothetical protein
MAKLILDVSDEHLDAFKKLLKKENVKGSELFEVMVESFTFGNILKSKLNENGFVDMKICSVDESFDPLDLMYKPNHKLNKIPRVYKKQKDIFVKAFKDIEILYNTKEIKKDLLFMEVNREYNTEPKTFYKVLDKMVKEKLVSKLKNKNYKLLLS